VAACSAAEGSAQRRCSRCAVPFEVKQCAGEALPEEAISAATPTLPKQRRRKYQKSGRPHDWRTRPDPFEGLWEQITTWLAVNPERTGVSLFQELQACYPGRFPDVQLRTLQRGLLKVRQGLLLTFEDHWDQPEPINGHVVVPELRAVALAAS
jgi:hypothetical protein